MWMWNMKTIAEQGKIVFRVSEVLHWNYFIFKYKKKTHPEATEAEPTSEKDLMKNPDDISENSFSWKESSISSIDWYPW